MKIETKKGKNNFTPVTVSFTIESEVELAYM